MRLNRNMIQQQEEEGENVEPKTCSFTIGKKTFCTFSLPEAVGYTLDIFLSDSFLLLANYSVFRVAGVDGSLNKMRIERTCLPRMPDPNVIKYMEQAI